ncbi:MAG: hypothetical protein LBV27_07535 [Oscillospiraceae bacterium]|jgi:hypothetical protein|nr:hypothetical protein [Oscillospiraceae bacterium]
MFDKRLLWTGVAIAATTLVSLLLVNISTTHDAIPMQEAVSDVRREPSETAAESGESVDYAYLLKEYEGRIAVFVPGKDEPEIIFDTFVKFLPDYDRIQMKNGIPVKDYATLSAIVEDYIS